MRFLFWVCWIVVVLVTRKSICSDKILLICFSHIDMLCTGYLLSYVLEIYVISITTQKNTAPLYIQSCASCAGHVLSVWSDLDSSPVTRSTEEELCCRAGGKRFGRSWKGLAFVLWASALSWEHQLQVAWFRVVVTTLVVGWFEKTNPLWLGSNYSLMGSIFHQPPREVAPNDRRKAAERWLCRSSKHSSWSTLWRKLRSQHSQRFQQHNSS